MSVTPKPTVLLADDHPQFVESVRKLLEPGFSVVGTVADGAQLVSAARELRPQVVVTDLMMEPMNGLEATAAVLSSCDPKPLIVMLTALSDTETVRQAFDAGVRAFVVKTRLVEDLIPAIGAVLAGACFLS